MSYEWNGRETAVKPPWNRRETAVKRIPFLWIFQCCTMLPKRRNPVQLHSMYWPDFQCLKLHWNLIIFKNILSKSCSSWIQAFLTPLESKLTDYVMNTDRLNVRRNRNFDHFLCKMAHFQYFAKSSKTPLKLIGQFGVLLKRCQKKREAMNYKMNYFLEYYKI